MPRLLSYHPAGAGAVGGSFQLGPGESHHLVRVRRAREGALVTVFDGAGQHWSCRVERADGEAAGLRVEDHRRFPPPAVPVTLAPALLKGRAMDEVISKAAELGAWRVVPVQTERCEGRLPPEKGAARRRRWQAAAVEACKQSGNPFLPVVESPVTLGAFLGAHPAGSPRFRLVAALTPDAVPPREALEGPSGSGGGTPGAACLIGPEGDFSPDEGALIAAAGFQPITLGPHVLRAETAALCALALLADATRSP